MTKRLRVGCFQCTTFAFLLLASQLFAQDHSRLDDVVSDGSRFVSVGQLAKVSRDGSSRAKYVLLDEQGEVISSLRPGSGVDLSAYVGQEVGVTARTLVAGDTPILLAENVTTFGAARQVARDDLDTRIALAAHEEEYLVGGAGPVSTESIVEDYPVTTFDGPILEEQYLGDSCGLAGCASCGGGCGSPACATCAACPCGPPGRFWIRSEYLIWWTRGMDTPAMLTTSAPGTPRNSAGVLGLPGTQTLYGDEAIFSDSRSGARFRIGKWCDQCNWVGFETDYFFLSPEDENLSACDVGSTIYARPFFNTNLGRQDSEIVQFPGLLNGSIHFDTDTSLWSIGPRLRINLACETFTGCAPDPCNFGGYRLDLLVGYRYMRLKDDVHVRERLASVDTSNPTYFDIRDDFDTTNSFHGADLGFVWEGYRGPWSLELIGRVGIGSTSQRATINGRTVTSTSGSSFTDPGGILALESNIGSYSRNEFSVLPEVSTTLGYAISPRTRFLVGYTFIYWNDVMRAGDIIDTNVNTDLIPPVQATNGQNSPQFAFTDTGFWAQGLSLGLEYRW